MDLSDTDLETQKWRSRNVPAGVSEGGRTDTGREPVLVRHKVHSI